MKQYIAGYILDNFTSIFEYNASEEKAALHLASWLSYYNLNSKSGFETAKINYPSLPSVLINIIQRGLPTKLNKFALETIVGQSSFLSFIENESTVSKGEKLRNITCYWIDDLGWHVDLNLVPGTWLSYHWVKMYVNILIEKSKDYYYQAK